MRVSLLNVGGLRSGELSRYNALVLPHARGGAAAYRRALGATGLAALRSWTKNGGTLIGLRGGAAFLAEESHAFSSVRRRRNVLASAPAPRFGLSATAVAALERMQGGGLPADGQPRKVAGPFHREAWPKELGIPGAGSPVLGPGARSLLPRTGRNQAAALSAATTEGTAGRDLKELALEDQRLRRLMPGGALLRVDLDPTHWLSLGTGARLAVMKRGSQALIAREPVRTAGRYAAPAELHLGGLLWPEAAGRISRTAWLTHESHGKGQLILFDGDPGFRGSFDGSARVLLNALLLGPGAGVSRAVPW